MKIYKIGIDFYAAKNLRDAVREYVSCSGDTVREALEDIETLSEKDLDEFQFVKDSEEFVKCSFREELNNMIARGQTFPCAFASEEWSQF